jgi:exopolysaccharide production protein ExoZ
MCHALSTKGRCRKFVHGIIRYETRARSFLLVQRCYRQMSPNTPSKLEWIQVLRAVAALMVLFFHMRPQWDAEPYLSTLGEWTKWGFSGVDIFFVLSGFVVYGSAKGALHQNTGAWSFLWRRFSRIYFGYWPVFLLVLAVYPFAFSNGTQPAIEMFGSFILVYPDISKNWIPTAWSLTFELMFYSWLTLFVFFSKNAFKSILMAMLVLVSWNAAWLALARESVYGGGQGMRYLLTGFGIEFLLGSLIHELYEKHRELFQNFFIVSTSCMALMIVGLTCGTVSPWFDRVEILRVGTFGVFGASCLILALAVGETKARAPTLLVRVGDASYSLYLLHPFLLTLGGSIERRLVAANKLLATPFILLLPVAIIIISLVWFRLVEAKSISLAHALSPFPSKQLS